MQQMLSRLHGKANGFRPLHLSSNTSDVRFTYIPDLGFTLKACAWGISMFVIGTMQHDNRLEVWVYIKDGWLWI